MRAVNYGYDEASSHFGIVRIVIAAEWVELEIRDPELVFYDISCGQTASTSSSFSFLQENKTDPPRIHAPMHHGAQGRRHPSNA